MSTYCVGTTLFFVPRSTVKKVRHYDQQHDEIMTPLSDCY